MRLTSWRLRQEDLALKSCLGYTVRSCPKEEEEDKEGEEGEGEEEATGEEDVEEDESQLGSLYFTDENAQRSHKTGANSWKCHFC